ncbi:uncharacterized protein LOC131693645 [Topomyia yanbarensis]|uniref:uncharacterized protein LOC131693645 n=1 Tax=Topomyia yanbarensis TaxID=2498891 RepID=UPI00273C05BB|nr:uncharacterized protein LOC131693645 [Topomyia yanbarensis]XP_058837623.1 uncharacterized protein LOC131693645 [Topomyia yanbarensis]XP_058837624.1 uncharacterized protein LOC131693645 [Topomyia yanbarensis]XP_058837626.1 uncharacterized protein LOC131693645 [Topomyia yanbarensis]XP_058837627.1 uncharacterized protein LOC131693645 [Topomyia yanbarensis]XP_058837628.1 uncharacterized protein LOC131693645 [Topomyia yanbarensis]XP_058837629.1 uncharacterized protein LOC131693645 [Topomyia yan
MHFWIDKRSQACGFGRARVAASLSSGGGLGFGYPRRIPRKSMVTPIHRFQTVDCTRPHPYRHQPHQLQQQPQSQNSTSNHQHYHPQQQSSNNQSHIQHHQAQLHSSGHYNQNNSILPASTLHSQQPSQNHHLLQQSQHQQQANNYHVPVGVNHIYSNASSQPNAIEIDHNAGTHGIGTLSRQVSHVGQDAQLLPAHLKCGMWASLALAAVFVAGAKFYFDHQGTGLEVLIFCAFSATFFLAACTVSLCRRPRDLQIPGNNVISETISIGEQNSLQNNPDLVNSNPSPLLNGSVGVAQQTSLSVMAPPPPYHIAILLPENTKEPDESPPPSYDKIVI